jgi:hypothetical protein
MKKIYLILMLILVSSSYRIIAQQNLFSIQYSVGFATGDFNKFISTPSWRGATVSFHNMVLPNLGIGTEIGWNTFYKETDYDTYTQGTVSLSGKQYRYCTSVPMLASFNYYIKPDELVNPYIGLGIGTEYTGNNLDMGLYTLEENAWHFALRPELGVIFSPSGDVGIIFSVKYYNAFKTKDIGTRNYFSTNLGLVWQY